jgi:hypothetical protein
MENTITEGSGKNQEDLRIKQVEKEKQTGTGKMFDKTSRRGLDSPCIL